VSAQNSEPIDFRAALEDGDVRHCAELRRAWNFLANWPRWM
jgi:hypothetical protein